LFKPRPAYRATFSNTEPRAGSRAGTSPPNGAVIFYYLPEELGEDIEMRLEIIDSSGTVIRNYAGQSEVKEEDEGDSGEDTDDAAAPAKAGLNQLVWNLRYPKVERAKKAVVWGFTGGPMAVPGTYQVRLTLGDWSRVETFEVLQDPRSEASFAELEEQFNLMTEIRDRLVALYDAVRKIRSIRTQIHDVAERVKQAGFEANLKPAAEALGQKLTGIEESLLQTKNESNQDPLNFPPMLDNQIAYLYGYVDGGNGRPTEGARQRFSDLDRELSALLEQLEKVVQTDVKDFEAQVRAAGAPSIMVPRKPE
jgi:hypothetical protein